MLHYQRFSYISEIIWIELITRHYNNVLAGHLGIEEIKELVARKYF